VSVIDVEHLSRLADAPASASAVRTVRVGLLGYGRVGQAVATLFESASGDLARAGLALRVTAGLVRDRAKPRPGPAILLVTDPADVFRGGVDVIVESLGGAEPARTIVRAALLARVPVVTANKTLVAHHGPELRALAARQATAFAFEAAVLAGVPCLGALTRRPLVAAVRRMTGIINGTSHFITSAMARGASFASALEEAERRGLAEPDSSADVAGRDAAEKLAILLQLAGVRDVDPRALPCVGIDTVTGGTVAAARRLGGTIKPVALASLDTHGRGAWIGPAFVTDDHPFARLEGVTNALRLTRADQHVVTFSGPGAGPDVTAVTMVDDIAEAIDGGAVRPSTLRRDRCGLDGSSFTRPPDIGWFLRVRGAETWRGTTLEQRLAARHLRALRIVSLGDEWFVRTTATSANQLQYAMTSFRAHGAQVQAFPVVDE
jgi:homoserine dehydrogenase